MNYKFKFRENEVVVVVLYKYEFFNNLVCMEDGFKEFLFLLVNYLV